MRPLVSSKSMLCLVILLLVTSEVFSFLADTRSASNNIRTSDHQVAWLKRTVTRIETNGRNSLSRRDNRKEDGSEDFGEYLSKLDKYKFLGWSLFYPDLTPYKLQDVEGLMFLATNLFFFTSGVSLYQSGITAYSIMIELAGAVSMYYHVNQLKYSGTRDKPVVVKALILDYAVAVPTVLGFIYELFECYLKHGAVPVLPVLLGSLGLASLLICWINDSGLVYMLWHGAWHLFAAAASYELARAF